MGLEKPNLTHNRKAEGTFSGSSRVNVNGLTFTPSVIIIECASSTTNFLRKTYFKDTLNTGLSNAGVRNMNNANDIFYSNAWTIREGGFETETSYGGASGQWKWYAWE